MKKLSLSLVAAMLFMPVTGAADMFVDTDGPTVTIKYVRGIDPDYRKGKIERCENELTELSQRMQAAGYLSIYKEDCRLELGNGASRVTGKRIFVIDQTR